MLLVFVVFAWLLIVALAVGIDFGPEIYREHQMAKEQANEKEHREKAARELILEGVTKYSKGRTTDLGLIVIQRPAEKRPGAHRKVRTA